MATVFPEAVTLVREAREGLQLAPLGRARARGRAAPRARALGVDRAASARASSVLGRPALVGEHRVADADVERVEPADRLAAPRSAAARPGARRPRTSLSGARTQNSSPPRRTSVSWSRTARCERPRDLAQDLVAGLMAEAVVDALEAVEVEREHA